MSFSHTLLVASWPQESTPPVEATSTPPTDVSSAAAGTGDGGETTPPPPLSKSQLKKLAKGKVHTLVHPTLSGNPCLRTFSVSMHFPSCVGLSYKQKLLCSCCLPPTHSSIFFVSLCVAVHFQNRERKRKKSHNGINRRRRRQQRLRGVPGAVGLPNAPRNLPHPNQRNSKMIHPKAKRKMWQPCPCKKDVRNPDR